MVSDQECSLSSQRALTQKRTLWGCSALQRGHSAPLEPLAELGDALGGVGAYTILIAMSTSEATDPVIGQAASVGRSDEFVIGQRALTQKQTLLGRAAHFSEVTALPLSPSHSLVMPSAVNSSFSSSFSRRQR